MKCPTRCDMDCEATCHEVHESREYQQHSPEACPAVLEDQLTQLIRYSPFAYYMADFTEAQRMSVCADLARWLRANGVSSPT